LRSKDLAVERVCEPSVKAPAVLLNAHQSTTLERLQIDLCLDVLEKCHLEGFAHCQDFERSATGFIKSGQASLDDLPETGRRRERTAQPPDSVLATQRPCLKRAEHDLSEEQDIALRAPMQ